MNLYQSETKRSLFKGKIILAPLAGVTEQVFRRICRNFGADLVYSEMISADAVSFNSVKTLKMAEISEIERPVAIQIFGAKPKNMGYAAAYIQDNIGPDIIDINCGCPVPKVVKKNGGAALLKDPDLYKRVIERVVKSVSIPVSVKLRSGWLTGEWNDLEYSRIAQEEGASCVILHPRSRSMGFTGKAFIERIGLVKKSLSIPVVGNGDIVTAEDAVNMFSKTSCDSVMIGRGAMGNPWIFSDIKNLHKGENRSIPSPEERIDQAVCHIKEFKKTHGENRARGEMKKVVSWYIKGLDRASDLRKRVCISESSDEIIETLHRYLKSLN